MIFRKKKDKKEVRKEEFVFTTKELDRLRNKFIEGRMGYYREERGMDVEMRVSEAIQAVMRQFPGTEIIYMRRQFDGDYVTVMVRDRRQHIKKEMRITGTLLATMTTAELAQYISGFIRRVYERTPGEVYDKGRETTPASAKKTWADEWAEKHKKDIQKWKKSPATQSSETRIDVTFTVKSDAAS